MKQVRQSRQFRCFFGSPPGVCAADEAAAKGREKSHSAHVFPAVGGYGPLTGFDPFPLTLLPACRKGPGQLDDLVVHLDVATSHQFPHDPCNHVTRRADPISDLLLRQAF